MRITWFEGDVFRLYVGGKIIVTNKGGAGDGDDADIHAAADHIVALADGLPGMADFAAADWKPKQGRPLLEVPEDDGVSLYAIEKSALFMDDSSEGVLIVASKPINWGRFADGAVVVLAGHAAAVLAEAGQLFTLARPRLLALAVADLSDAQFAHLAEICGNCAVQVLEPGLALEA